jgi:hypothetical protein
MSTVDLSKLGNIINDGTSGQVLTSQGGSAFSFADAAAGGASVTSSDTAPSSPSAGDLWFDSSTAELLVYYSDGSSNQWVTVSGEQGPTGATGSAGSSVTSYAAPANFPSSGNTVGDFAFATNAPKALYVWDGAEWDRVWSGGQEGGPTFTTSPNSTYALTGGANTDVTVAASEPDGFPITYSVVTNPTSPSQLTGAVSQPSSGVFRFAASNTASNAGSFTAKFIADDGVQKTTSSSNLSLAFQQSGITGVRITQTASGNSPYTVWQAWFVESDGSKPMDSASLRSATTFQSANWGNSYSEYGTASSSAGTHIMISTAETWMDANTSFGSSGHTDNTYAASVGVSTNNQTRELTWSGFNSGNGISAKYLFLGGSNATASSRYFGAGYAQLYINGSLESTQRNFVGTVSGSSTNNTFVIVL